MTSIFLMCVWLFSGPLRISVKTTSRFTTNSPSTGKYVFILFYAHSCLSKCQNPTINSHYVSHTFSLCVVGRISIKRLGSDIWTLSALVDVKCICMEDVCKLIMFPWKLRDFPLALCSPHSFLCYGNSLVLLLICSF